MKPHVDGAAASTAESQLMLLHHDGKPRWKCGEIYTWNSMDLYAVECALCDDKNLCTLTEFATHMQIWHQSWECVSNDEAANSEDEFEMAAQNSTSKNKEEPQKEENDTTDTETDDASTEDEDFTLEQQSADEQALDIHCSESNWNLPTTDGNVSDNTETADCTTAALVSPNQLKICDEIAAGQDSSLPQPFEEVLIIDVGAETEPSLANHMKISQIKTVADDQMESETEINTESEEKFELENQLEKEVNSYQADSKVECDEISNDTVTSECAPNNQLADSGSLNVTANENVCYGENLPPHNGKLTKEHMLLLIELYKAQPRLWNTSHKEFSETHLCRASWQNLTQTFNSACKSNFEINELKIRISTLCQRYLAEKQRLSDELEMNNNESPKFSHFNALRFLDEQPDNLQSRRCIFYRQNLKLIEVYKNFPILWHSAKKHKLSPATRAEALQEISETLKNFNIHLSRKSLQRRLHVLQKCYHNQKLEHLHCQREKRKFRTNFKHYAEMQFLDRHIAPYVCNICKKIFEKVQEFRIHMNNENHEMEQQQQENVEEIVNDENDAEIIKSLEKMKVTDNTVFEQLDMEDSIKINIIDNSKKKDMTKRQPTRMTLDDISSIISNDLNNDRKDSDISMERNVFLNGEVLSKDSNMAMLFIHEPTELLKFLHSNSTTANQKNTSTIEKQSNNFESVMESSENLNLLQKDCTNEEQILNISQNSHNDINIVQDVMSNTEVLSSEMHYSMNNSLLTFNDSLQNNILSDMIVTSQNSTIETESLQYVLSNTTDSFSTSQAQDINNVEQLYCINTADYTTTPLDYSSTASTSPMAISQNGINILHDEAFIATQYLLNITPQNNLVMPQDFLNDQLYAMNVPQHSVNNSPNSCIDAQDANTIHFSSPCDLSHHSLTTLKNATYAPSINNTSINTNDIERIVEEQVMSSNALMTALNCNVTAVDISAATSPYRKSDFELDMELRNAAMNCSTFHPLLSNECTSDIMAKPPEIILEQDLPVLQREIEVTADLPILQREIEVASDLSVQQCGKVIADLPALQHEREEATDFSVLESEIEAPTNLPALRRRVKNVASFKGDTEEILESHRKPITAASVKRLTEEQTHHLIRLYKEQPVLWNPHHKHFESRRGRRLAWKAMTNALNKFYNIRFPWQTIYKKMCDCSKYYRKEKTRATGKKSVTSKWCYYNDFSFLDEHLDVTSDEQKTLQDKELNLKIIKIYRNYPQLWNTNTAEYKKRSQRNIHTAAMHNNLREQCNVEIPLDKLRRKLIELRFTYRQEKEKRIECAQNNEAFESFYEYYKEMEFLDEHISPFVCNTCGEAFTKLTDIICHYRVTKHQKIIKKRMSRKKVAAANAAEVELKNICHICGAKFTMRNNLMYHLNRHLGKRNHKCTMCPKSFYNTTALRVHERSHTKEYPYVCEECGQAFVNNSKLNQHKKRHRNQRDFKCDECGKEFFSAYERDKHVKRHKKVRDTFCPICGKGFVVGSSIYSHMDLHSEVKKYVCKICEKRFAQYSGLYRHMRVHNLVRDGKKVGQEQEQEQEIQ